MHEQALQADTLSTTQTLIYSNEFNPVT